MASNDGTNVPLKNAADGSSNRRQKRKQTDENLDTPPNKRPAILDPFLKLNPEEAREILKYLDSDELLDATRVSNKWKSTIESSGKVMMDKLVFKCTNDEMNETHMDLKDFHEIMTSKRAYKHMVGDAALRVGNQTFKACQSSLVTAKIFCNSPDVKISHKIPGGNFTKLQKLVIKCQHPDDFFEHHFGRRPCYHYRILNFIRESSFPELTHLRICEFHSETMSLNVLLERFPKLKVLFIDQLGYRGDNMNNYKWQVVDHQPRIESMYLFGYCQELLIGFGDTLKEIYCGDRYRFSMRNVQEILVNCSALERLTLLELPSLRNSVLPQLELHENLKYLRIDRCRDEDVLIGVLQAMPALSTLMLNVVRRGWGWSTEHQFSANFIEFLANNLRNLKKFICRSVTVEAMESYNAMKANRPFIFELIHQQQEESAFYDDFLDRHFNNDKVLAVSTGDEIGKEILMKSSSSMDSKQEKVFKIVLPELVKYLAFSERLDCMLVSKLWKSFIESSSMDKIVCKQTPAKVGDLDFEKLLIIMRSERKYEHIEAGCTISVGNYAFSNFASSLETLKISCNMSKDHCKIAGGNFIKLKKLFIKCDTNMLWNYEVHMKTCYHRPILNFIKESSFPEVTHLRMYPWDNSILPYDDLYRKFPKLKVLCVYDVFQTMAYMPDFDSSDVRLENFENQPKIESLCMSTWSMPLLSTFSDTLTEVYIYVKSFNQIEEIFRHLKNLQSFAINSIPHGEMSRPFPKAANLHTLSIDEYFWHTHTNLENFIESQPSITNLFIKRSIHKELVNLIAMRMRQIRTVTSEYAREDVMELYRQIRESDDNQYANNTFEIRVIDEDRTNHFYLKFQYNHFNGLIHENDY